MNNWYKKIAQVNTSSFESGDLPLNEKQRSIFDFIKRAKNSDQNLKNIKTYAVGGFCRDKIMGKQSDDLDIAISASTGLQFAQALKKFGDTNQPGSVGKIYSTALDKTGTGSGDLQVAAVQIYGQKIDIVNLRTQQYDQTSRVPVQTITDNPLQDAKRRDLTINALYCDTDTGKIMDFIGALKDFQKDPNTGNLSPKILRTPDNAQKTFKDDPLRMLRLLRFKARYPNAEIDKGTVDAMSNIDVQNMYSKVAPQRASKQIVKLMQSEGAAMASRYLLQTGLYRTVFQINDKWHPITIDQQNPFHDRSLMQHTLQVMQNYNKIAKQRGQTGQQRGLMMLSTLLHDFGKMDPQIRKQKINKQTGLPQMFDRNGEQVQRRTYVGHEFSSSRFAEDIMKKMGFDKPQRDFVATVTKHHMRPHDLDSKLQDKNIGKYLKDTGDRWEDVMYHGQADSMGKGQDASKLQQIKNKRRQNLQTVKQYRQRMGDKIFRPIIDGNKIKQILTISSPQIVSSNVMISDKNGKRKHFLSMIIDRLLQNQWSGKIQTPEQAQRCVVGEGKNILAQYKQQQKQKPKLSSNWYSKIT